MRCLCIDSLFRCNFTLVILLVLSVSIYIFVMVHIQTSTHFKPAVEIEPLDRIFNFNLSLDKLVHKTHEKYMSFMLDSSFVLSGMKKPYLRSKSLITRISHLSGGYLRIGGNTADRLIFKVMYQSAGDHYLKPDGGYCSFEQITCHKSKHVKKKLKKYSMSADTWSDINLFVKQTGLKLLFNLNVLWRQDRKWNSSNAELLMDFAYASHLHEVDWELGNEPNSYPFKFEIDVTPEELAYDFGILRQLLNKYTIYEQALIIGPGITHPRPLKLDPAKYLENFLVSKPEIDVISWHHYYTGPNATVQDFLNVGTLNSFQHSVQIVNEIVRRQAPQKQVWLTESGSAYGGGVEGLSDKFISSFLWLDRLGTAAKNNISVVVRQSLFHPFYSLLDENTLFPNPDYWVSVLFKTFVGHGVLNIDCLDDNYDETLRVYAHCGKGRGKHPVLFGLNISNHSQGISLKLNTTGNFYSLTSPHLASSAVHLNGKLLELVFFDQLPSFIPVKIVVNRKNPIPVLPYSLFFLVLDISVSVC